MSALKPFEKFALYSSMMMIMGAGQGVHAHAGFKEAITEGTVNTWNAVTITHGCNTNSGGEGSSVPHQNVIAFSAVFPDFTDTSKVIVRRSTGTVPAQAGDGVITPAGTGTVGDEIVIPDLSNDIVGSTNTIAMTATLGLDTGGDQIFANTIPIADTKGSIRGWQSWSGPKPVNGPVLLESAKTPDGSDISTTGLSPFRISGIRFQPNSCAKALKIRVAVADWCRKGAASYQADDRADIWIGSLTPKFNEQVLMPNADRAHGGSGAIFWPTLTVNRNLAANPRPDTCTDADYDTVYIEPKAEDIDALLPISKAKYPVGAGAKYWPAE